MCHLSHVTCHVSHVRCHVSGVTCQVSSVTFFSFLFDKAVELVFPHISNWSPRWDLSFATHCFQFGYFSLHSSALGEYCLTILFRSSLGWPEQLESDTGEGAIIHWGPSPVQWRGPWWRSHSSPAAGPSYPRMVRCTSGVGWSDCATDFIVRLLLVTIWSSSFSGDIPVPETSYFCKVCSLFRYWWLGWETRLKEWHKEGRQWLRRPGHVGQKEEDHSAWRQRLSSLSMFYWIPVQDFLTATGWSFLNTLPFDIFVLKATSSPAIVKKIIYGTRGRI